MFWSNATGWPPTPSEALESEEITFYAEGLMEDGFHLTWTVVALADTPDQADHIRLHLWQDGHPPPALPPGWVALQTARWTAA